MQYNNIITIIIGFCPWMFNFTLQSLISFMKCKYMSLEHKSSHKYICSNNQQYIVWVKIIDFSFMPKIIRILSKDHVPWRYLVNFLP